MASSLPEVTFCVLTYKSPEWTVLTLRYLIGRVRYNGPRRYHIADGGSDQRDLDLYREVLKGQKYNFSISNNLSDQFNSCADAAGDVWLYTLDDFMPESNIDITPDVSFLLENPDAGMVRMGRLAFFECNRGVYGQMKMYGGLHWWVLDKERTGDPHVCSINAGVMHRRFWDAYGPLPPCPPHLPGIAENLLGTSYNGRPGPAVALPVRFGENDASTWRVSLEPFQHIRPIHGDDYAAAGGGWRWAST